MHDQHVKEDNRTLETVACRNERSMKLEKFVTKFTQAVDKLEKRNQGLHNDDVVDLI